MSFKSEWKKYKKATAEAWPEAIEDVRKEDEMFKWDTAIDWAQTAVISNVSYRQLVKEYPAIFDKFRDYPDKLAVEEELLAMAIMEIAEEGK